MTQLTTAVRNGLATAEQSGDMSTLAWYVTPEQIRALCDAHDAAVQALEACNQCITDFIEVYKRGASMLVYDEALKSLRDDALKLTRAVLAKDGTK